MLKNCKQRGPGQMNFLHRCLRNIFHPICLPFSTGLGLLFVMVALLCASPGRAETLLDWTEFAPVSRLPMQHEQFYISVAEPDKSFVVLADSSPKNPFPEVPAALYVDNDTTTGSFRIWCRAFTEGGKSSGTFEFPFRMDEGQFDFVIGQNTLPFAPKEVESLGFASQERPEDQYFSVSLVAGEPITIGAERFRTASVEQLSPETNYILRVEWDFAGETPGFRFFVNGEPLTLLSSGDDYLKPATQVQIKRGVDSCAFVNPINAGRSKYFLGPLTIQSHPKP